MRTLLAMLLASCATPVPGYDFCRDSRMPMGIEERRALCEPRRLALDGGP